MSAYSTHRRRVLRVQRVRHARRVHATDLAVEVARQTIIAARERGLYARTHTILSGPGVTVEDVTLPHSKEPRNGTP